MIDSADLVGVEIGRRSVKAIVLSSDASSIMRFAEAPYNPTDLSNPDGFPSAEAPIQQLWRELGLDLSTHVRCAVAVSHDNSGVGSGPSIEAWIDGLGKELDQTLVRIGERFEGVSYFPKHFVDQVTAAFEPTGTTPDRVELAPISAARCFNPKSTCSFTVDSHADWRARIHSGLILEAMIADERLDSPGVAISKGEPLGPISTIYGLTTPTELLESLRVEVSDIAVVAGAARGLLERTAGNLLEGTSEPPTRSDSITGIRPRADIVTTGNLAAPHKTNTPEGAGFQPLPPKHVEESNANVATASGALTYESVQATPAATPAPLDPGQKRAGFEPTDQHAKIDVAPNAPIEHLALDQATVLETTAPEAPMGDAVTPAFLPPSESTNQIDSDVGPSAEPKITSLNPGRRGPHRDRPSTIEAQRPKIDHHEDKFPSEPFAEKSNAPSTSNLKLVSAGLLLLIILGLAFFFVGPV